MRCGAADAMAKSPTAGVALHAGLRLQHCSGVQGACADFLAPPQLTALHMDACQLAALPGSLAQLVAHQRELSLSSNPFGDLPECLAGAPHLLRLDWSYNKLAGAVTETRLLGLPELQVLVARRQGQVWTDREVGVITQIVRKRPAVQLVMGRGKATLWKGSFGAAQSYM